MLVETLHRKGVAVALNDDGSLAVDFSKKPTDQQRVFIRDHKTELMTELLKTRQGVPTKPAKHTTGTESDSLRGLHGLPGGGVPVREPEKTHPSGLTFPEERTIISWLVDFIGETDQAIIDECIEQARTETRHKDYYLKRYHEDVELPRQKVVKAPQHPDDRRTCNQCTLITQSGNCLAIQQGDRAGYRATKPNRTEPKRCFTFKPRPSDPDQRIGLQRWPGVGDLAMADEVGR